MAIVHRLVCGTLRQSGRMYSRYLLVLVLVLLVLLVLLLSLPY